MQTNVKENLPMRARYYQAVMDVESLGKRRLYSELPDSYIVFICLHDPFDGGLPRYTVKSTCIEDSSLNEKVNDKILKVYYNANEWNKLANDDDETKAFLKFLTTQKPKNKLEADIMEQVMYARGQEPWRIEFMQLEELKEEGRKEAQAEIAQRDSLIAELKARLAKYESVE